MNWVGSVRKLRAREREITEAAYPLEFEKEKDWGRLKKEENKESNILHDEQKNRVADLLVLKRLKEMKK